MQVESVQVESVQVGSVQVESFGSRECASGNGGRGGRSFGVPHVTHFFFKRGADRTTVEYR